MYFLGAKIVHLRMVFQDLQEVQEKPLSAHLLRLDLRDQLVSEVSELFVISRRSESLGPSVSISSQPRLTAPRGIDSRGVLLTLDVLVQVSPGCHACGEGLSNRGLLRFVQSLPEREQDREVAVHSHTYSERLLLEESQEK